ncbi:MAG: cytochrome c biogenesis protein CcdA [Methanoregula sp.]
MILTLFEKLTTALDATPGIALSAAFVWGILSILLSPCHLSSIPLIIGFISGRGNTTTRRAFGLALVFAAGIFTTIVVLGVVTGLLGRMLGDIGVFGNYLVAAVFFVVGLYFLGVIRLSFLDGSNRLNTKKSGFSAAFVLGLIFGTALGPCTFAYMAPLLAIALNLAGTRWLFGVSLLIFYGIGHASVIVLAGTFTSKIQGYLNWSDSSRGMEIVRKICGVLIIVAGIYMVYQTL